MSSFINRIIRSACLDIAIYEEIEADREAMGQAIFIVVLSSLAAGIGIVDRAGLQGILIGTFSAIIGWYIWAWLTYIIGTKLLPEPQTKADLGELLRTTGFSSSPGLIRFAGIFLGVKLAGIVFMISSVWMLLAMIVAVRQALDYRSTIRAVSVCIIGWIIQSLLQTILFFILLDLIRR